MSRGFRGIAAPAGESESQPASLQPGPGGAENRPIPPARSASAAPWADPALSQEDRLVIRSCLEGLREEEQRAVLLHVLGGFRFREIAAFEGEPLSTVLSRYHRAMKKLRKVLS